jgi:hypothetical protein
MDRKATTETGHNQALTGLLTLYRKACRLKLDRRLKPATDTEHDFVNLVNELL